MQQVRGQQLRFWVWPGVQTGEQPPQPHAPVHGNALLHTSCCAVQAGFIYTLNCK